MPHVKDKNFIPKVIYQKLNSIINLDGLPPDIHVSTITLTCCLDTEFYVQNIGKYIDLSIDKIQTVKFGNDINSIRTLIPKKIKSKKRKKVKKIFYNQTTVIVKSKSLNNLVNVKLFKNGSIQMTGCKNLKNFVEVFCILCEELSKKKAILDPKISNKIILKPFCSKTENVNIDSLKKFEIRMINSNLKIGFKIDREKFYKLLLKQAIECNFEPCAHAGVNVKYNYKNSDKISIFIFESGSIIITGAKNKDHIIEAYNFITKKLYENYNHIILNKIDIETVLNRPDIKQFIKNLS
ncbi:Transcription (TATA-box-binding) factor TFIID [uncultured virus]|nr:Transcription (TATA-box-binding) factor TFIID [uncultured virus]